MAYKVLARKWRPLKFEDVIGQDHITRSLQNAITRNRLGHAYIFTGTRGIGKTSVARIFAKAVRCESRLKSGNACEECRSCQDFNSESSLNVIEIDGASNNSVDDIRDLISKVHSLPTFGLYKIYIIDEVHMLSTSAFNALLKTLEEPPQHVIFILATTEPDKLLDTVLSRCQRFDFRNASIEILKDHVKKISEVEGINFQSENLIERLCEQGKGSVRDTLSLLDQVLSFSSSNDVDEESFSFALGLASTRTIASLASSILLGEVANVSKLYRGLLSENISTDNIMESLLGLYFNIIENIDNEEHIYGNGLLDNNSLNNIHTSEFFWVYETLASDYSWASKTSIPHKVLEVILRKVTLRREFFGAEDNTVKKKVVAAIKENQSEVSAHDNEPDRFGESAFVVEESLEEDSPKTWDSFLNYLREISPASASNLEQGNILNEINIKSSNLVVDLAFPSSGKVFYDFITEAEVTKKLKQNIESYFNFPENKIELNITLLSEVEKETTNFLSKAEIAERKELDSLKKKEKQLLQSPIIKKAEELFNAKIDKVKINR